MHRGNLLIFFLLISIAVHAQDISDVVVDGTVKEQDGGHIIGATVSLIQDGSLVNKVTTGKNGRFDLVLNYGHEYIVEISKSGFASKRLYFNTHKVPEDEQAFGHEWGGFVVDLFKEIPGLDYSILEKPTGKVYYDPNFQNFEYDRNYTKLVKAELDRLQAEYEARIRQEEQMEQKLEEEFLLAMKDAEIAIKDNDFVTAKENLLAAASIKPDDPKPKQRLAALEQQMASQGKKEEQYLSLLATADQLFGSEKYEEARAKYQEASLLKPAETYPKEKIKECDAGIAKLKAETEALSKMADADRKYKEEVDKADKEFMAGNYLNAKSYYQNALGMKGNEPYPQAQIKLADQKLAELATLEAKKKADADVNARYAAQIDKADAAFKSGSYANAKTLYVAAQEIKPAEEYPKTQLALIDQKLAELDAKQLAEKEQLRINTEYKEHIAQGDKLFASAGYEQAKAKYEAALGLKPAEQYPKDRIAAIDNKLAELGKQKQAEEDKKTLDTQYAALVASGDNALRTNDLVNARSSFEEALKLKPAEKYPQQQLLKIADLEAKAKREETEKERLAEQNAEIEKRYAETLALADGAFSAKNYTLAKEKYVAATSIKPGEQYPKSQVAEIARLIALEEEDKRNAAEQEKLQEKVNEQYNAYIAEADKLLAAGEYEKAKGSYNLAAGIKPGEAYPPQQIAKIDDILKEQQLALEREEEEKRLKEAAEAEKVYQQIITMADGFMDTEDYESARKKYEEASALKPQEAYPKNQMELIRQRIAAIAAAEKEESQKRNTFNEYMRAGDQAILEKQWDKARQSYEAALALYADEPFPKARLKEIDELERKDNEQKMQEEYAAYIAEADKAFLRKEFESARAGYNNALRLFPTDVHASTRVKKIDEIMAARGVVQASTNEVVEKKITEETYDEGRSKITIRRVTIGEKEDVYKKVEHSWGGKYYFLNDRPISELIWTRDTNN